MIKPPFWSKILTAELLQKSFSSPEYEHFIEKAQKKYLYWDKFRYTALPVNLKPEEAWALLKVSRLSNREKTPITSQDKTFFSYAITKSMYRQLRIIDSNTSGLIRSELDLPSTSQRNQLIVSGLSEEAIASSQIEGANTSRKVAKEMILSERKPRTRSEQMVINNYQVMQRLQEWKDLPLSEEMLLEIQRNITTGTMDNPSFAGRFRVDEDEIHVMNSITGEVLFTPPSEKDVRTQLKNLIQYANLEDDEDNEVHPVIKACILHFWLAYLHPFPDGNGRTARALFYWYLLKKNYWLFQYLSVSRIIKKTKNQYDNAFLYSEHDEGDLTYFLVYKLKTIISSLEDFAQHYTEKVQENALLEKISLSKEHINERQASLLNYYHKNPDAVLEIKSHQNRYLITYETARSDFLSLVQEGYLTKLKKGKKFVFVANISKIKTLLHK